MTVSRAAPDTAPGSKSRSGRFAARGTRWRPRWSLTHFVMVAAGLLAFLAMLAVLRDREIVVELPVMLSDVAAGDLIAAEHVGMVTARGPSTGLTDAAITAEELEVAAQQGLVAARYLPASSLLSAVDLTDAHGVSGERTMSIPIASTDGVGKGLVRGDVVDVVVVVDGLASFVATGVDVVGIVSPGQSATGSTAVSVEVDAPTSLRVAWALSRTEVRLVRATGAPAADLQAVYPEPEARVHDD